MRGKEGRTHKPDRYLKNNHTGVTENRGSIPRTPSMKLKITEKDHRRYFQEKGGFSPERNQHIIDSTIKKHDRQVKSKEKDFVDGLRERTDAAAWYLLSRKANSGYGLERYFSKRELAHLRGQQIVNKLSIMGRSFTKEELIRRLADRYAKKEKQRQENL